jgi:hypothetical protein
LSFGDKSVILLICIKAPCQWGDSILSDDEYFIQRHQWSRSSEFTIVGKELDIKYEYDFNPSDNSYDIYEKKILAMPLDPTCPPEKARSYARLRSDWRTLPPGQRPVWRFLRRADEQADHQ